MNIFKNLLMIVTGAAFIAPLPYTKVKAATSNLPGLIDFDDVAVLTMSSAT